MIDPTSLPASVLRGALPRGTRLLYTCHDLVDTATTLHSPVVYDFYGFPEHHYQLQYEAPRAPALAGRVKASMAATEPVLEHETRGLDHGAWVPLMAMYPYADIPVLQMSMPDLDPAHLLEVGRRLAPLREEGVLIIGSGFMTLGTASRPEAKPETAIEGFFFGLSKRSFQTG